MSNLFKAQILLNSAIAGTDDPEVMDELLKAASALSVGGAVDLFVVKRHIQIAIVKTSSFTRSSKRSLQRLALQRLLTVVRGIKDITWLESIAESFRYAAPRFALISTVALFIFLFSGYARASTEVYHAEVTQFSEQVEFFENGITMLEFDFMVYGVPTGGGVKSLVVYCPVEDTHKACGLAQFSRAGGYRVYLFPAFNGDPHTRGDSI